MKRVLRLLTHAGETMTLKEWERRAELGEGTLWRRLARGETLPHALRKDHDKVGMTVVGARTVRLLRMPRS